MCLFHVLSLVLLNVLFWKNIALLLVFFDLEKLVQRKGPWPVTWRVRVNTRTTESSTHGDLLVNDNRHDGAQHRPTHTCLPAPCIQSYRDDEWVVPGLAIRASGAVVESDWALKAHTRQVHPSLIWAGLAG